MQPKTRSQLPTENLCEHLLGKIQQELDVISTIEGSVVVLLSSNLWGQGDDKVGNMLMKEFLHILSHMTEIISSLILINSAVFLVTEGSETVLFFREIQKQGVEILCSDTCLNFYGLQERLQAGRKASMYTISSRLLQAQWVISL